MSSKKALKQAQKQNYARFKNNISLNSQNPFNKNLSKIENKLFKKKAKDKN
tara:strand:- start:325 stop:477 length:153 start_codon:yes stop_codon:yes gene_type:complete